MTDNPLKKFINESFICEEVKLPLNIIFHRTKLSPDQLALIKDQGEYSYPLTKNERLELEINGEVLAEGEIIKRNNEYFFKIVQVTGGEK